MKIFKDFERKLEGLFEGVLLRAFKSGVQPVFLGKKLVRELEGRKTIGVSRVYVPNRYEIGLSARDYSRFESYQAVLASELENLLIAYIREKGYAVLDRPRVRLAEVEKLREGEFWIRCRMEGELPGEQGAIDVDDSAPRSSREAAPALELQDSAGDSHRFPLGGESVSIGRGEGNDIVLPDPNVSRLHANVNRLDDGHYIIDMGSTNGTWLNERRVVREKLRDEDVIRLGSTRLVFRRPGL